MRGLENAFGRGRMVVLSRRDLLGAGSGLVVGMLGSPEARALAGTPMAASSLGGEGAQPRANPTRPAYDEPFRSC